MGAVRQPAVAGMFYPGEPGELSRVVAGYLGQADPAPAPGPAPKALIVPHAGYIYSGPIAASAYALLAPLQGRIDRVVLIGPSHRVAFRGLAVSSAAAYAMPGGAIALDRAAIDVVLRLPGVGTLDPAHTQEHSLEVHLPFLQAVLGEFALVPVVAGDADAETVAALLDALWGGPETLIVISTDLSHYLDYEAARRLDAATAQAIEHLDGRAIGSEQACGRVPVRGLLAVAKRRGLAVRRLDLRNSGDTAGPRDRVVGYGAWAFYEGKGDG
ncbi:MAG: AmmeMemoRadiSam system protein B [Rhodospirillales bacterium]|nr:AmmeMemoRadiSam system protein B [Rhodospirillales bacterium]